MSLACPVCQTPVAPRLRLVIERASRAAKRPVTPEIVTACRGCGELFMVSLNVAPERVP
jgi:hypothetical protein